MNKNIQFSLQSQGHASLVHILPPKPVLSLVLTFKNPPAENND